MNIDSAVPLTRRFKSLDRNLDTRDENFIKSAWGLSSPTTWTDLRSEFRTVIISDAGAGKTFEMKGQAQRLHDEGLPSFFIRIEDIDNDFDNSFEVGNTNDFSAWLNDTTEAWFFLDSVDEARLESPKKFERAIKQFSNAIQISTQRAHIYISTRPHAWRAKTDSDFIDQYLPHPGKEKNAPKSGDDRQPSSEQEEDNNSGLKLYWLDPLNKADIRLFALHRSTPNIDGLMEAIERANLWNLAERPFDLDDLLNYWVKNHRFGSRLNMVRDGIIRRLREIKEDREQLEPLRLDKALSGAQALAAAVTLCKDAGIRVPDGMNNKAGIAAEAVLDWDKQAINALLAKGIFNDLIFGIVRFRHREIRELLTAQWLHQMMCDGGSRQAIESLIFRNQYGEDVITPTMRPVLPWLILFDEAIRKRAIAISPEIAVEGGDPAEIPLHERRKILKNIVERIAKDEDDRSARDNAAIARIAQQDLTMDTLGLIDKYQNNDDAIFFLGRLVWQGAMANCVDAFFPLALNPTRGIHARIASVRAITSVGSVEQGRHLWQSLIALNEDLPRELLRELITDAVADVESVELLLASINKLPPMDRHKSSGLREALSDFIERLPADTVVTTKSPLFRLAVGFNNYLDRQPQIERRECAVSEQFSWLIGPAMQVVEQMIVAQSNSCFSEEPLAILTKVPAMRDWRGDDFNESKSKLAELVPKWPELNDALYWQCIADIRKHIGSSNGRRLTDDCSLVWRGHFWQFDADSFERAIQYVNDRPFVDDRLVALNLAFRIYSQNEEPIEWLQALTEAAASHEELATTLNQLANPPTSEERERVLLEQARYKHRQERMRLGDKERRKRFVIELQSNPEVIRNPPDLPPGEMSNGQLLLMEAIEGEGLKTDRRGGSHWQHLIPEFGNEVAEAYRDAARTFWRCYTPGLGSEGADTKSVPYALLFALSGLEIERQGGKNFPVNLTEDEVKLAFRYITWEINGLPLWTETLYKNFPTEGMKAIWHELCWELNQTPANEPLHYILDDLVYHAPWLHLDLAVKLHDWLRCHEPTNTKHLNHCLHILINGQLSTQDLSSLAEEKIDQNAVANHQPIWFALWVETTPDIAIPRLTATLDHMDDQCASIFMQSFVVTLVGKLRGHSNFVGNYRTATHLKALYRLAHQYIRSEEDIERAGTGVYSPQLRDNAQDARNRLFSMLVEIPGKDTYLALQQLANDHPSFSHRQWMVARARNHAIQDADLESWQPEQIKEFSARQEMTPNTHRQLFELGVSRLFDFKHWLESGYDSAALTYQKADDEQEMRIIVANWLNTHAWNRYTCAQEYELANAQRLDICLQHNQVPIPVPIELKLLDKNWSGPDLCERLRNQLAGDYLRDAHAGCGVFLLIWQGKNPTKQWEIDGMRYPFSELQSALAAYWATIATSFSNVVAIEIICIDLTLRDKKSALH